MVRWSVQKSIWPTRLGLHLSQAGLTHSQVPGLALRARRTLLSAAWCRKVALVLADEWIGKGKVAIDGLQPGPSLVSQEGQKERGRGRARVRWQGTRPITWYHGARVHSDPGHQPAGLRCRRFPFWWIRRKSFPGEREAFRRGGLEVHLHPNGPSEATPYRFDLTSLKGNLDFVLLGRIPQQIVLIGVLLFLPE